MFVSVTTPGPPGILRFPIDFIFHDLSQAFGRSSEPAAFVTSLKSKSKRAPAPKTKAHLEPSLSVRNGENGPNVECTECMMGVLFGDLSTAAPVTLICRASLCLSCFAGVFLWGVLFTVFQQACSAFNPISLSNFSEPAILLFSK